jgi:hypothetical protein
MTVLESRLVIKGVDESGPAFASAEARVNRLGKAVAGVSRAVGATGGAVASASSAAQAARNAGFGLGAVASAASMAANYALIGGGAIAVHAAVKAVGARQHEMVRMAVAGMRPEEIAEATAAAAKLTQEFPAVDQTEMLHMLRNARSIVGNYKEAAEIAEPLTKLRVLAQLARPGEDVSEDFDQLIKGLEIKGVTQNPKQFREYMEGIAKGINVFGDTLKPYQYYEMFKYGRQATSGLSEKFILGTAPTLAQELGGSSYGRAVSAFNAAIVGGVLKTKAVDEFYRLGLLGAGDVKSLRSGNKQILAGHSVKGWREAQEDPNAWVRDYLVPALDKLGIKDRADVMKEVSTLFQNQMAGQMVSLLATQQSRIDKDLALLGNAPGLAAADRAMREDPSLAWQGLKASIEALTGTLGQALQIASAMTDAAQSIARLNTWLGESQAQKQRDASLAADRANSHLNRLAWGVDTPDFGRAADVAVRKTVDEDYKNKVIGWTSRADELTRRISLDTGYIAFGTGDDPAVQRAYADRDAARAELERVRAEATQGTARWRGSVELRGEEDYQYDLDRHRAASAAVRSPQDAADAAYTVSSIDAHIAAATRAAEEAVFGKVQVQLDPNSKADVNVKVQVDATEKLLQAIATVQASAEGALAVHVGRMDTDAAPRRYNRAH